MSSPRLRFRHLLATLLALQLSLPVGAETLDDLLNAAKLGDAREVARQVAKGMDANSTDENGNSLLILAAREDQPKVVAELLRQRGIKVNARNAVGDSALMLASLKGHTEVASLLLGAGADFSHEGWNPLLYAAFEGRLPIVELLLAKGANPNARAPNQSTPLMFAARNGHEDVVVRLLKAGADPDLLNDQKESAESWAIKNRNTDIAGLIQAERKARAARAR